MLVTGEAVSKQLLERWFEKFPGITAVNAYGPAEASDDVTLYFMNAVPVQQNIPVGKPVQNMKVYILDKNAKLCAAGIEGEICVAGIGVGRGYLGLPQLTTEKFIKNPFADNERMYRTGDAGRWLKDGNIEYAGRKDDQVKIRGYRIELGEIENSFRLLPDIDEVVVLAKGVNAADNELVAYYVSAVNPDVSELRSALGKYFPSYMIPAYFMKLDALPLTPNGKIDKKALKALEVIMSGSGIKYVAARNKIELELVTVYEEVLKRKPVGIREDFFMLGGDSIKSIQIASRLRQRGYSLSIRDIMQHPLIEDLAHYVKVVSRVINQELIEGEVLLNPVQRLFLESGEADIHHYNQSVLLNSKEALSETALRSSLEHLVLHHDALRMVYFKEDGSWKQQNKGKGYGCSLEVVPETTEEEFRKQCDRLQSGIDLEKGPLFKAVLFKGKTADRLLLIAHHLIIDGVSWRILFEDLSTLYSQICSGAKPQLPLKTDSFKYWQEAQHRYAFSAALKKEESFWSAIEAEKVNTLPLDHASGSNLVKDVCSASAQMDEKITEQLLTQCYKAYGTDINDVLLTGLSLGLKEIFGMEKVLLALEGHGREQIGEDVDVTRTVGWFTTMYPVLFDMGYNADLIRQLIEVKESLHRVPNKGIGYGTLRYITGKPYTQEPQITFNYLGDFGSGVESAKGKALFEFSGEYHGKDESENMKREAVLEVSGKVVAGKMNLYIAYSNKQFNASTINSLLASYEHYLRVLCERLSAETKTHLSPSDLSYKELSIGQVTELNKNFDLQDVYPLSPLQQGMYFQWLSSDDTSAYFEQMSYTLKGRLNIPNIEKAYQLLVEQHAVLRTSFRQDLGDTVLQVVKKEVSADFRYTDFSEKEPNIERYKIADREKGFDLSEGSQMRLSVFYLGNDVYEFTWSHHHILMDAWCIGILINDFFKIYQGLSEGKFPEATKIHPYSNYIEWVNARDKDTSTAYWKKYLSGYEMLSTLPDMSPKRKDEFEAKELELALNGNLKSDMVMLCAELGVTENIFIQTVWGILLSRYNTTNDVVFGSVVSGRPGELEGVEEMIGLFINTVPVRILINEQATAKELLKEVQRQSLESSDHHYTQLAEIQSENSPGRELFDHIMVFENYPVQEMMEKGMENNSGEAPLELVSTSSFAKPAHRFMLSIFPGEETLIRFDYDERTFPTTLMEQVRDHLINITEEITKAPGKQIKDIEYLSEQDKHKLLVEFNDTKTVYPSHETLVSLFEKQVSLHSEKTAVVFKDRSYSYMEINRLSNCLSNYLKENHSIERNDLVCLKVERSEWMIISILAVLKLGAAYVPVDPDYPGERIDYILADTKSKVLIDDEELNKFRLVKSNYQEGNTTSGILPSDLAYVIYTSGSTGQPKGCMLEHKGVVNRIEWMYKEYNYSIDDVILFKTTYTFDVSVWEIFMPLCWGTKMVICEKEAIGSPEQILSLIEEKKISCLHFVPSMLNAFIAGVFDNNDIVSQLQSLRLVITSGEALPAETVRRWYEKAIAKIHNLYGPTEASVDVSYYATQKGDEKIPIGKPIDNTQLYILDGNLKLVGQGISGEVCIGGDGLARGYLNKQALTEEKFIVHPFRSKERIYRTGDIGRWLEDGNIEYLGRMDDQVKIRGYRIELGEIENALKGHEGVESVVVIARSESSGDKSLVAYVTGKEELNASVLKTHLANHLPAYMIPSYFVQMDTIPLTGSGKVNRKALPDALVSGMITGKPYVAARTKIEKELVQVYENVLKRNPIGIREDFFLLGGDSIKSIQIVSRLRQKGYSLSIRHVMQYPIIEDLARYVKVSSRVISQETIEGEVLLGPVQHLFLDSGIKDMHHYNQSVLLNSTEKLSEDALRFSLDHLVLHHDALRMVYSGKEGNWQQENKGAGHGYSLEVIADTVEEDFRIHCDRIQSGIDLEQGPLFKAAIFRGKSSDRLLLVAHHLVIDGVSWRILFEDLSALYAQSLSGVQAKLPLKTDSFQYWQKALYRYALSPALLKEESYWRGIDGVKVSPLPLDNPSGSNLMKDSFSASVQLDDEVTLRLLTQCYKAYGTDINDVLLTGLGLGLKEIFGMEDVLLTMEGHGREQINEDVDVSRTVGWFTTMYPVFFSMRHNNDMIRQLIEVKESLHGVPNKGLGYGVLRHIKNNGFNQNPEITFNYLGDFGAGVDSGKGDSLFEFSGEYHGKESSEAGERNTLLDVSAIVVNGRMTLTIVYSKEQYKETTIASLLAAYEKRVKVLSNVLSSEENSYLTPSSLTYKQLSVEQVSLLNENFELEDVYPLSPLQEGIYFHWLAANDSSVYFEQMNYKLKGKLNRSLLEEAFGNLISKHAVLRTSFAQELGNIALQVVRKRVKANYYYEDRSGEKANVESYMAADRAKGFDLGHGSQMRLAVFNTGNDTWEFIWSFHHILMDGWCIGILINDFFKIYQNLLEKKSPVPVKIYPYSNYIQWVNALDKEASIAYWKNYLSGFDVTTSFPKQTAAKSDNRAKTTDLLVNSGFKSKIIQLCAELGVTENTFIQTAWGILLSNYNSSDDVVFGSVVSGRPGELEGVEDMIGLFINTVPVRITATEQTTVNELLKDVQRRSLESTDHYYTQLAEIQAGNSPGKELFDHIMVFENYPVQEMVEKGMEAGTEELSILSGGSFEQTNYDLTVSVFPGIETLIRFTYTDAYDGKLFEQLRDQLIRILEAMVTQPENTVSGIECLGEDEKQLLVEKFNDTVIDYPSEETIARLFEDCVKKFPERTALVFEKTRYTYKELNEVSNAFAHYLLKHHHLKREELVAVKLERSDWMIICLLGILKAGAAYLPVDIDYPQDRIEYMLKDGNCGLLIDETEVFKFKESISAYSVKNVSHDGNSRELAYVMYTSGSTGNPKGVMIEQRSVIRLVKSASYLDFQTHDKCLSTGSFSFDAATFEFWGMLLNGGMLVMCSRELLLDPQKMERLLHSEKINVAWFTAGWFNQLADIHLPVFSTLKTALIGGDKFSLHHVNRVQEQYPALSVKNCYGPTENTTFSTYYEFPRNLVLPGISPIGKPISNSRVYILRSGGKTLCPLGVTGEIYVAGDGLSRGYFNNPKLTAEKFISDPFKPGEFMYRTGDLARWLEDGNIDFEGRMDTQVKIRGYRIELAEIENALRSIDGIEDAVMKAEGNAADTKELVAYIICKNEIELSVIRDDLSATLPGYMIPALFVKLKKLPLTSNGKVDYRQLKRPAGVESEVSLGYVAPRNETEEKLVSIWEEILGREKIGVKDNFFELGGHSLKAVMVLSRINKLFDVKVDVSVIFKDPVIETLAKYIEAVCSVELENTTEEGNELIF